MRKSVISLFIGMISVFLLSGCGIEGSTDESFKNLEQTSSGVVEGTTVHFTYSICDAGVFYIGSKQSGEWTTLRYYDYESDKNYILCSSANCEHNSTDCPAYVGDNYYIYGFACYEGKLYYLRQKEYNSETIEFVCTDVDGTNRKVIAELETGDYTIGSWKLDSVISADYSNGKAIIQLKYLRVTEDGSATVEDNGMQTIMIDLSDGTKQELTDIMHEITSYSMIELLTEKYMIQTIYSKVEPYLSENDFYDTYGETESYVAYLEEYYRSAEEYQTEWCINLETGEKIELRTIEPDNPARYIYEGVYEDKILIRKVDDSEKKKIALYFLKPETKETTPVIPFAEEVTGIPGSEKNYKGGYMYDEGQIMLYYQDDDTYIKYIYSLEDGSMKEIRNQKDWDDYFVAGTTGDRVLLYSNADSSTLCWLSREDYEAGNFDKIKKLNLQFN